MAKRIDYDQWCSDCGEYLDECRCTAWCDDCERHAEDCVCDQCEGEMLREIPVRYLLCLNDSASQGGQYDVVRAYVRSNAFLGRMREKQRIEV